MRNKFIPYDFNLTTEMFDIDIEAQFFESILRWHFTLLKITPPVSSCTMI